MTTKQEQYEKLRQLMNVADKAWQEAYSYASDNGLAFNVEDPLPTQGAVIEEESWSKSSQHWGDEGWEGSSC